MNEIILERKKKGRERKGKKEGRERERGREGNREEGRKYWVDSSCESSLFFMGFFPLHDG